MYYQTTFSAAVKTLFMGILLSFSLVSCNTNDDDLSTEIRTTGIIQAQGITTYQYGTHIINEFALRSNIDLDQYIGQTVSIVGIKIAGYPVDGGPDYLEVIEVK